MQACSNEGEADEDVHSVLGVVGFTQTWIVAGIWYSKRSPLVVIAVLGYGSCWSSGEADILNE